MLDNNILGKTLVSELNLDQDTLIREQNSDIVRILAAENNISDIKDSLFTGGGAEFIGKLREYGNFDSANNSHIAQNTASDDLVMESTLLVPEAAKTYTVTTAADENDGGSGGTGLSLREAITLANTNDGADTIKFATSLNGQTLNLVNGNITISDDVTIDGRGRNSTIISRISGVFDRIFTVYDGSSSTVIDVTIEGVTLTNGLTSGNGGAIFNRENLTIENSKIFDNSASGDGGGISNLYGTLTITDTTISGNSTGNAAGGGISNLYGTLTITDTTISGNSSYFGGGISNRYGTLTITDTTISGNSSSGIGGGIYSLGTLTITDTTISGNSALGRGGGIANGGAATITNTSISDNSALGRGGGIWNYATTIIVAKSTITGNSAGDDGGGFSTSRGTLTITDTTISGNSAGDDGGGFSSHGYSRNNIVTDTTISGNSAGDDGGGISSSSRTLTVTNSTISGNSASDAGGGIWNNSRTTVANSTITGNSASGDGGGIYNFRQFKISSTIVAGNVKNKDVSGGFVSAGNNLIGNGTNSYGFSANLDDIVGTSNNIINPLLAPLADNGGPTKTHALKEGSVAINAGNNLFGLTTDQRGQGFSRTVGGATDIGAFEVQGSSGSIINGTAGNDTLTGTSINETINGLAGNDELFGNGGNDSLFGNSGIDILNGGAGADILDGGTDSDLLTGGGGGDIFVLSQDSGGDTISDFQDGIDKLELPNNFAFLKSLQVLNFYDQAIIVSSVNNQVSAIAALDGISADLLTQADVIFS